MEYFSCANTSNGFINYFDDAIDKKSASQILYIKGGSGIGKSTFMRKAIDIALDIGYDVDKIYCSSDTKSLDGVVIKPIGIAIFDATMPHISDPIYPRINGKIVDLGIFLDEDKLKQHRNDIMRLVDEKKQLYKSLYSLLSTLNTNQKAILDTIDYDKEAVYKIEKEIVDSINPCTSRPINGFLKAIDHDGIVDKTEFLAQDKYTICINCMCEEISTMLISNISSSLSNSLIQHSKFHTLICPNNVETILSDNDIITCKNINNIGKIYNIDNVINIKNNDAYMILLHYKEDIINMASKIISKAKERHSNLEEYYKSSMDYSKLDIYTNYLLDELFEV